MVWEPSSVRIVVISQKFSMQYPLLVGSAASDFTEYSVSVSNTIIIHYLETPSKNSMLFVEPAWIYSCGINSPHNWSHDSDDYCTLMDVNNDFSPHLSEDWNVYRISADSGLKTDQRPEKLYDGTVYAITMNPNQLQRVCRICV
ncbi:MAG: hypothetical protein Q4Q53_06780 [Methanocorpusculum sp.]|nr:hypothetical protein [Methanocorpusculum sp.]